MGFCVNGRCPKIHGRCLKIHGRCPKIRTVIALIFSASVRLVRRFSCQPGLFVTPLLAPPSGWQGIFLRCRGSAQDISLQSPV